MDVVEYAGPGVLRLAERPVPSPGPGEVLVEVAHFGVCGTDLHVWEGGFDRVRPPVVMGHEFCGVVADANGAEGVPDGQRVVVEPLLQCGSCHPCRHGTPNVCASLGLLGIDADGAAARYVAVAASRLHPIPDSLSLRDAALGEPTAVAVHMLGRAGVRAGDAVLVVGGGPIGALVASVCRAEGVTDVVVSEPGQGRRELVADLGFAVVDPSAGDLDGPGDGFDIAFELTGVEAGLADAVAAVRPRGTVLLGGFPHHRVPVAVADAVLKELHLVGSRVYDPADFDRAIPLLDSGAVPAGRIITREVALADAVEDAFVRVRDGRDDMKIIVTPPRSES